MPIPEGSLIGGDEALGFTKAGKEYFDKERERLQNAEETAKEAYCQATREFQTGLHDSNDSVVEHFVEKLDFIDEQDPLLFWSKFTEARDKAYWEDLNKDRVQNEAMDRQETVKDAQQRWTIGRAIGHVNGYGQFIKSYYAYKKAGDELCRFDEAQTHIRRAAEERRENAE